MTFKKYELPTYHKVIFTKIDLSDTSYSICPADNLPPKELIENIRQLGILHPPLIKKIAPDSFIIVSGKKRIIASRKCCSPETITCLVIPENTSEDTTYHYLLHHALIGKKLSIVEQALFFQKSSAKIKKNHVLKFLKPLGYKAEPHYIEKLLKILTLEKSLLLHLHEGIINPKALRIIERLSYPDQKEIGRLINKLKLGGSKQQKLADFCYELMRRNNKSFKEIINEWDSEFNQTTEVNIPQITNSLFQWLHSKCYPQSKEAEIAFNHFAAELKLADNIQIQHTRSFEDEAISLSIAFKDKNSFKAAWEKIKTILTD